MKNSDVQVYASTFASFLMRKLGDDIKDIDRCIEFHETLKNRFKKELDIMLEPKKFC